MRVNQSILALVVCDRFNAMVIVNHFKPSVEDLGNGASPRDAALVVSLDLANAPTDRFVGIATEYRVAELVNRTSDVP